MVIRNAGSKESFPSVEMLSEERYVLSRRILPIYSALRAGSLHCEVSFADAIYNRTAESHVTEYGTFASACHAFGLCSSVGASGKEICKNDEGALGAVK